MERSRKSFIIEAMQGEKSMSLVCREYGITRRTGYKWLSRIRNGEPVSDRSHRIKSHPNKTLLETEQVILAARERHPAWGARKLKRYLEDQGITGLPAQSTICGILKRNGLILPEESAEHTPYKRFEKSRPNEMWQMDFKGNFALLNGKRCHPLTVLDDHSRFSLCLDAKENEQRAGTWSSLMRLFEEYGLPESILSDNGPPWGDSQPGGYTYFDLWLMQLGILPIHGKPRHPQTQGKDERFHRTLKAEVLKREVFHDCESAQQRFDVWRNEYNYERPHNALDLETPSKRYRCSKRKLPATLPEPEYDGGKNLRLVNCKGYISILSHRYYLSEVMAGKVLQIKQQSDKVVTLHYGSFQVAKINLDERLFESRRIYRAAEN